LKESVVKALSKQMMTREQILEGVLATGYRFRASNP
jgi:alkylhydroperoxidase family enzyme